WILRTTSIPLTTRPKAANPWPSGLRLPPKSSSGWSPTQMKKSPVAVSGPSRAIDSVPSLCASFVSRVRSSLIGANSFAPGRTPDQPRRRPAEHHHAHAAALRHVDDLLLRRPPEDRQPVARRREAHDRVERLAVHRPVRADHRELAHRQARQLLHHPALLVG